MKERELYYIKTIIEEQSVTKASQKLYVSQPSLSQTLLRVEESLGLPLFTREPNGLIPTPAGQEYYRVAVEILDKYESFKASVHRADALNDGRLAFGLPPGLSNALSRVLPEYIRRYPNVGLQVREESVESLCGLLCAGSVNFALLHMDDLENMHERFELEYIADNPWVVVAAPDHPLSRCAVRVPGERLRRVELRELAKHPLIRLQNSSHAHARLLAAVGLDASRSALSTHHIHTAIQLALTGMGIFLCPYLSVPDQLSPDCILSLPDKPCPPLRLCAAYYGGGDRTRAERAFFDCAVARLQNPAQAAAAPHGLS